MVGAAGRHLHDSRRLRRLRDLGSLSEPELLVRPLPVAVLRSRAVREFAARLVRPEAGMVARLAPIFAGAAHPSVPRPLSLHLLLLSRRVLQGLLGRSAELRGRRAPEELLGRSTPASHRP